MVAGLGVAAPFEDEIEAGVERELLEEVVVESRARRDADAARAVEREPDAQRGLRRRAHVAAAPLLRRRISRERGEQEVVVLAVAHGDADRVREDADDAAGGEQPVGDVARLVDRHVQEVRARRHRREAARMSSSDASRSRSSTIGATSGGDASAASASATESVDTCAGGCRAFSSAATSREASA